jgi:hypothetical protein
MLSGAIYMALRRFLSRSDQGFSPWAEDEAIPSAESARSMLREDLERHAKFTRE